MALDRDRLLDPLPTIPTPDCLRALPRPSRVRVRLTAHIKQTHRACPTGHWSVAPWLARTLVIVIQAAEKPQWI
jgi:hypothetical protein